MTEIEDRPGGQHYGGEDNPFEPIKIIRAMGWAEGFCRGNALKYLLRAGKKGNQEILDLKKVAQYVKFEVERLEAERDGTPPPEIPDIPEEVPAVNSNVPMDIGSHFMEIHPEQEPIDMSVQDIDAIAQQEIASLNPAVPGEFEEQADEEAGVDAQKETDTWSALKRPELTDSDNGPGTPNLTPPSKW